MKQRPFILIIEDDEWFAEQQVRALDVAGFEAEVVLNAVEAMDAVDVRRPAALLCDVFLAGPNIFTLLHELRSHADLAAIPVVLCTNSADHLSDEDVAVYGVRAVLDKTTMTPGDVVAAMRRVVL